jgi:hypothetical protein
MLNVIGPWSEGTASNPFSSYPHGGQVLLGRPPGDQGSCRMGYSLGLQRVTGQSTCAYCRLSMVDDYYHWLLMSVDHEVPRGEALRLGIDPAFSEDVINLVLCCAGCNGFGNRYRTQAIPHPAWSLQEFLALRDQVFADRYDQIATRRLVELARFAAKPWDQPR